MNYMKDELISNLHNIADVLYKGATNQGIAYMGNVIPAISVMADKIDDNLRTELAENILTPILEAMSAKDGTLLADLITYELIEFIEKQ